MKVDIAQQSEASAKAQTKGKGKAKLSQDLLALLFQHTKDAGKNAAAVQGTKTNDQTKEQKVQGEGDVLFSSMMMQSLLAALMTPEAEAKPAAEADAVMSGKSTAAETGITGKVFPPAAADEKNAGKGSTPAVLMKALALIQSQAGKLETAEGRETAKRAFVLPVAEAKDLQETLTVAWERTTRRAAKEPMDAEGMLSLALGSNKEAHEVKVSGKDISIGETGMGGSAKTIAREPDVAMSMMSSAVKSMENEWNRIPRHTSAVSEDAKAALASAAKMQEGVNDGKVSIKDAPVNGTVSEKATAHEQGRDAAAMAIKTAKPVEHEAAANLSTAQTAGETSSRTRREIKDGNASSVLEASTTGAKMSVDEKVVDKLSRSDRQDFAEGDASDDVRKTSGSTNGRDGLAASLRGAEWHTTLSEAASVETPPQPIPPQRILDQVLEGFEKGIQDGGRVRISLHPENLGRVDLDVIVRANRVDVVMAVDNDQVQQVLSSHVEELRATLRNAGWQVDGVDVSLNTNLQDRNPSFYGSGMNNLFWDERTGRGNREERTAPHSRGGERGSAQALDAQATTLHRTRSVEGGLSIFA